MGSKMDMSLDDIIAAGRKGGSGGKSGGGGGGGGRRGGGSRPRGRGDRRSGGGGGGRRNGAPRSRSLGQSDGYTRGNVDGKWSHDMFSGARGAVGGMGDGALRAFTSALASSSGPGKLLVSNLDYGVSEADIHELFSEFGSLKIATIHYDKSGRSLGTAEVSYDKRSDAIKAMKQYNGVPLDGKAMKIEIAGSESEPVAPLRRASGGGVAANRLGRREDRPRNSGGGGGGRVGSGRARSGRGGGAGGGGGAKREKKEEPSKDALDAEMEEYMKSKA